MDHPPKIPLSEAQPDDGGGQKSLEEPPLLTSRKQPRLLDLPPELIKEIFMYLNCHDRVQLSEVCPALFDIYHSNIHLIPCVGGLRDHKICCRCGPYELFFDDKNRGFAVYRECRRGREPIWHYVYLGTGYLIGGSELKRSFIRTGPSTFELVSHKAFREPRRFRYARELFDSHYIETRHKECKFETSWQLDFLEKLRRELSRYRLHSIVCTKRILKFYSTS